MKKNQEKTLGIKTITAVIRKNKNYSRWIKLINELAGKLGCLLRTQNVFKTRQKRVD